MTRTLTKWLSAMLIACLLIPAPAALMEELSADSAIEIETVEPEAPALDAPVEEIGWALGDDDAAEVLSDADNAIELIEVTDDAESEAIDAEMAAACIPIDADHFPDAGFRKILSDRDLDGDGVFSPDEIEALEMLEIWRPDDQICSLEGIAYLTGLKVLQCGFLNLTSADLTQNPGLIEVSLQFSGLTSIDVGSNAALEELGVAGNDLTVLDVSGCPALTYLRCDGNQLTTLDVSGCSALEELDCAANMLTTLDVSRNRKLEYLNCSENYMTALDLSGADALISLSCEHNQLASIDLTRNPELVNLICYDNALTELDISNKPNLGWLEIGSNPLKKVDVSGDTELWSLDLEDYGIDELDVTGAVCLRELYLNNNNLTSLDVSTCAKLRTLYCQSNGLKTLKLGNNAELAFLYCADNALTTLDVSGCAALMEVNCAGNAIATLDLSNILLGTIISNDNLQEQSNVTVYGVNGNRVSVDSTTLLTGNGAVAGIAIDEAHFPDANFRAKIANDYDFNCDGALSDQEIKRVTSMPLFDSDNIASLAGIEYFTSLTSIDVFNGALADLQQIALPQLTGLSLNDMNTTALDCGNFPNLEFLYCSYGDLTALDVSKNTKLKELYCTDNQLTSLDVTNCPELDELICYNNQFTTLDVSKNPKLTRLECAGNRLTSLDVSKNTALGNLECGGNQFTTLDISKNTKLEDLYCENNRLTRLDVSKNTALRSLQCADNQLTTLNVGKNAKLEWLDVVNNRLTALDISKNSKLEVLRCYANQITELDLSNNLNMIRLVRNFEHEAEYDDELDVNYTRIGSFGEGFEYAEQLDYDNDTTLILTDKGTPISAANFPDAAERAKLRDQYDLNKDGALSDEELAQYIGAKVFTLTKNDSYTINVGEKLCIALGGETAKSFNSSKTKVASVDGAGLVTALTAGKANITVTLTNKKKLKLALTVVDPTLPTELKLDKTGTVDWDLNQPLTLSVTLEPASTAKSDITWKSSATKVATVKDGALTFLKEGKVTITATADRNKKATAKVTLNVYDPLMPTALKLDSTGTVNMDLNETLTLTPTLEPATALSDIEWKSSSTKVATVKDGVVTPVNVGKTTITATSTKNKKAKATVKLVIKDMHAPKLVAIDQGKSITLDQGKTLTLTATVKGEDGYAPREILTWKSSKPAVVAVDEKTGVITAVKPGTAKITVTTDNKKKATITVKVPK